MRRPLVIFALIFCLGLLVASKVRVNFTIIYLFALASLLLGFFSSKKKILFELFLCCFVFFFAAGVWKNSWVLPGCHIFRYHSYKNRPIYTVTGIVDSQPTFKNNTISFVLKAKEIKFNDASYNTCGNMLLYLRCDKDLPFILERFQDLQYGEALILSGSISRPFKFGAGSGRSYRNYLYSQGIFSVMNVRMPGSAARLRKNRGFILKRVSFWLKERMENIIFKRLSPVPASVVDAMILGEKKNIPALINNSMMKSGTVHILVVSGFNVALVAFIIVLFLKLIRVARAMRFYITCPLIVIYCLMTGDSTPVVRAAVMAIVFMLAYLIKREPDIYNSCALAALFILMINPRQLFDIGFQLSFVSVISIVYVYPRLKFLFSRILKIKFIGFMVEGCLVSVSAWLGTMAFIAYYFRIISPITVLANMFIVPLASLITLCGFSLIIMELICPFLAPYFAYTSELAVSLLLNINAFLIQLPHAYFYLS